MTMKKIFITFFAIILTHSAQAQINDTDKNLIDATSKGWHIRIGAGYLLGGTAPLPMPVEIRGIKSFNPGLNLSLEGSVQKRFGKSGWGVQAGLRFDTKGMTTDADTKNYQMVIKLEDTEVAGCWTGKVKTHVSNTYVSIPLLATYSIGERWNVNAGLYASFLLKGTFKGEAYDGYLRDTDPTGEKKNIESALYDFSNDIRKFHWGVQAGGEYKIYRHLGVFANIQWGLNGIFPSDYTCIPFALKPIYATFGFNYIF